MFGSQAVFGAVACGRTNLYRPADAEQRL